MKALRELATSTHTKRTAIGGGTVGLLLLVYELFVTKAEFAEYRQDATRKASVVWQELKTLENDLDSVRMAIVRLETLKTNTP